MDSITALINKLCPDGSPFAELGELTNYEQPTKYLVDSVNYSDDFTTPVLTPGQTYILGFTDETEGIKNATLEKPLILFDDFTTAHRWITFPFKVKSSAVKLLTAKDETVVSLKFLFYSMQSLSFKPTEHARHWISVYSKFKIALPPIEVQREIVNVLDTFTVLEAELEAELEARRKQYEYYRNQLLRFPEQGGGTVGSNG